MKWYENFTFGKYIGFMIGCFGGIIITLIFHIYSWGAWVPATVLTIIYSVAFLFKKLSKNNVLDH